MVSNYFYLTINYFNKFYICKLDILIALENFAIFILIHGRQFFIILLI